MKSGGKIPGLLSPGTILSLFNRPETMPPAGPMGLQQGRLTSIAGMTFGNPVGERSTTYSKSFNIGGREVLLPTVINGQFVTDNEAVARYLKTGEHLGIFDTPASASSYAGALHNSQEQMGNFFGIGSLRKKKR
jgi:hypothetical protein